jgi:hypothetical protein
MINRRRFITAFGVGMLALRKAVAAKARFDLGIGTYTYRGVTEDEMIENLKTLKIQHIELSSPAYFLPGVKLDSVPHLRTKLGQAGITAVSYFCGDIKTESDCRSYDSGRTGTRSAPRIRGGCR